MSDNPLEEANPLSLDLLFSADPKTLSDSEIEKIVQELRRGRLKLLEAELAGKTTRSAPTKAPKAAKIAAPANLSLDDLGL